MTKAKGRPPKSRLADMSTPPTEPARFTPPPRDELYEYHADFGDGVRMHHEQGLYRDRLVEFSVCLSVQTPDGWKQVCRIDTAHGEVHMHEFRLNGPEVRTVFEVIPFDRGEEVIDRWFTRAAEMMENEWRDYLVRWQGDEG
jgi:hypothetical protein